MQKLATEKQIALLAKLAEEREFPPNTKRPNFSELSVKQASEKIEQYLALPKKAKAPAPVVVIGVHKGSDGRLYKVVKGRQNGARYAKLISVSEAGLVSFVYVGRGPILHGIIDDNSLLPWEEAAAFGRRYSFCVNCGAELDDPNSVAAGYGPVCAKNHGWPHGAKHTEALKAAGVIPA